MHLNNPETKKSFTYKWYSNNVDNYETFNQIPDFFINNTSYLTEIQSNFYNEVKFPNYDNIDNFSTLIEKASRSLFAKKLDEEISFGSKILEVGCGTGQLSIFLSRFGRKVFAIDISRGSLIEGKKFIDKCGIKNVYFSRMNLFKSFFPKNYFDFVISNGVLHHTHSAKLAFQNIIKLLKPQGYVLIGLYHKQGRFLHSIRQKIIRKFGKNFIFLDSFFKKNISEEKKKAWFFDQYKNPSETSHSVSEVMSWFKESDIDYISSVPFDFESNVNLLKKRNKSSKYLLMIKEQIQLFNLKNLKEGGFFIVIGKKNSASI
jgi:SAM-dependent methyltransferase